MGSCKHREIGFRILLSLLVGVQMIGVVPAHAQNLDLGGLFKGVIDAVAQQENSAGRTDQQNSSRGSSNNVTWGWGGRQYGGGGPSSGSNQKYICLSLNKSGLFQNFSVRVSNTREDVACYARFWAVVDRHSIHLDSSSTNQPGSEVEPAAVRAGIVAALDKSIAEDAAAQQEKQQNKGSAPPLSGIAFYPLLTPDNKVHKGALILDGEENPDLLRARTTGLITSGGRLIPSPVHYVFLKKTQKTTFFHPGSLRIGGGINVIGRYVANSKYLTVGGEQKIAPVLEALFVE